MKYIRYYQDGEWRYASVKSVGDLEKLKTTAKDDLVSAINDLIENGAISPATQAQIDNTSEQVEDLNNRVSSQEQLTSSQQETIKQMNEGLQTQEESLGIIRQTQDTLSQIQQELQNKQSEIEAKVNENIDSISKVETDLTNKLDLTTYQEQYKDIVDSLSKKMSKDEFASEKQTIVNNVNSQISSQQQQIESAKLDISNLNTKTQNIQNQIDTNASKLETDISNLQSKIKENENAINQNGGEITNIKSDLDTVKGEYQVQAETLSNMNGRLSDAESSISVNSKEIASKVSKTEFDNLQIGGRNLVVHNDELKNKWLDQDGSLGDSPTTNVMKNYIPVTPNEILTFHKTNSNEYFRWNWYDADKNYIDRMQNQSNLFQWTIPSNAYYIWVSYPNTGSVKIERGSKATDWSPAPEDVDGQIGSLSKRLSTAETSITQNSDAIALKANSEDVYKKTDVDSKLANKVDTTIYNQKMSEIDVTTSGISQKVSNIEGTIGTGAEGETGTIKSQISEIDQKANDIKLQVDNLDTTVDSQGRQISDQKSTIDVMQGQINLKANASDVYTKTDVDAKLSKKVDQTTYNNKMSEIDVTTSGISQKVSNQQTTIDNISGKVITHDSEISTINQRADQIELTVSSVKDDVDALSEDLSTAQTQISQNKKDISLKASQQSVNDLGNRVSDTESRLSVQAGQIASKVSQDTFEENVGINKWVSSRYSISGTDLSQIAPSFSLIKGLTAVEVKEVGDSSQLPVTAGTNQITHFFTNIFLNTAKTITLPVVYDDSIAVFVNGASVYSNKYNNGVTVNISVSLRAGWNTLEILHGQASGDAVLKLGTKISDQVDKLTSVIGVGDKNETRLTQAETDIKQTSDSISLMATKTEVKNLGNRVSDIESSINVLNNQIASKVEQTTFDNYSKRLEDAESKITQNADSIASKVEKTDFNLLNQKVSTQGTSIEQLSNSIALKADSEDVNALDKRVDDAESQISLNTKAIDLKASQKSLDTLTGRVSDAESKLSIQAGEIASKVSKTEFDNLQIGGANLAPNSTGDLGTDGWRAFNGSTNLVVSDGYQGHKSVSVTVPSANGAIYTPFGNVEGSGQYTMSFWVKADKNCTVSHLPKFLDSNNVETNPLTGSSVNLIANTWTKVEYTFIAPSSAVKAATTPRIGSGTFPTNLFVSRYKLEKGAKATDWTPAPEDIDGQISSLSGRLSTAESSITQTQKAITLKANAQDVYTKGQVDNSLAGKASTADLKGVVNRLTTAESQLSVQAGQIASKVSQTDFDNLTIGGRNLVPNSTGLLLNPDGRTAQFWQDGTISHKNADGTTSLEVINSGTSEIMRSGTVFNVEPNTTYVFRARIKGSYNSTTMDVYFLGSKTTKTGIGGSYNYIHLLATGTTNKNDFQEYITKFTTNSDEICGYVRIDNNASSNGSNSSVYFSQIKLEKGNKVTDWTPAPEDVDSRLSSTESSISQLSDSIALKAEKKDVYTKSETDGKITNSVNSAKSEIKLTTDGISQQVSSLSNTVSSHGTTISSHTSQIKSLSDSIELKVSKTEFDNLEIGGRNLLVETGNERTSTFSGWQQYYYNIKVSQYGLNELKKGGKFFLRGYLKNVEGTELVGLMLHVVTSSTGTGYRQYSAVDLEAGNEGYVGFSINLQQDDNVSDAYIAIRHNSSSATSSTVIFKNIKLEKGNRATDWTPAPEDTDSRLSNAEGRLTVAEKAITSKVSTTDYNGQTLVSMINQTPSTIKIAAKNVELTGAVTFNSLDVNTQNKINNADNRASKALEQINANKANWDDAHNIVNQWKGAAENGRTTINGGLIQTNTVLADKMAIGDFTNYASWDKNDTKTFPFRHPATYDESQYHTAGGSIKLPARQTGIELIKRIPVVQGDRIYYEFWIKTDSNWNGKDDNSKLRFGNQTGALLMARGYSGIKTSWTKYNGVYVVPSGVTTIIVSIGNDGTTGNVWIDDINISKQTAGELIVDGSITADKLNVNKLSSLSSDLGDITGGSININNNFIVDRNGNLTANNGTFMGNVRSADDKYKMGTEIYSGGLYTAYSSDTGSSFTSEFDSGYISLKEYPTNIPFNKSNIWESIQKGKENFKARISARGIECWSLNTPGNYLDSEHFYIERGKDRGVIYSTDNMEVSVDFGDLKLAGGNIYLTPLGKVYLKGTINIDNNIDLSWDSYNKILEFSRGIKSGNVLLNENTVQANNIVINGAHSIISNDGGQLYFTDSGGKRIDITVRQVHADQWIMPYNMKIGYHTIQTNDNGEIWFNGANGSLINIKVATLHYTGSLSKSSSESIKTNITPMNFSALDEIMKTDFYSYNYISDLERGVTKPNFGPVIGDSYRLSDKFLTQDAQAISIDSMTAINSQAIKEVYEELSMENKRQNEKISILEEQCNNLIIKNAESEERISNLEQQMTKVLQRMSQLEN